MSLGALIVSGGAVAAALGALGCASEAPRSEACVGESAAALRTCAKGATLRGIDVSYYQGTVSWSQVKASGNAFAFARVSDGLNYPDTKFAQNWPAMKSAKIVRGAYQFFRPAQDPVAQADLLLSKIDAAGGLLPGDLPPVLDLESDGGLSPSVVVARAMTWLAKVEAAVGKKPIVYTAAFMSNVIGTSFGGYPLWVANYGATCPLMPSGFTDWVFWQDSDSGSVSGVSGNVDTNFFNGSMKALEAMTIPPPAAPPPAGDTTFAQPFADVDDVAFDPPRPNDGSQGATIGQATPPPPQTPASAPLDPCAP